MSNEGMENAVLRNTTQISRVLNNVICHNIRTINFLLGSILCIAILRYDLTINYILVQSLYLQQLRIETKNESFSLCASSLPYTTFCLPLPKQSSIVSTTFKVSRLSESKDTNRTRCYHQILKVRCAYQCIVGQISL